MARKTTNVRITKSETYVINRKYLGDEPTFSGSITQTQLALALNWYNYMYTVAEAREFLITYLENNHRTKEAKLVKHVPDTWVSTTAGWVARMFNLGYDLEVSQRDFINNKLTEMFEKVSFPKEEITKEPRVVVSVQDRMKEKAQDIIGDIEAMIDAGTPFKLYEWLKGKEIPAIYAQRIVDHYQPWADEIQEALTGQDSQLKEAYSHFTKKQLRDRLSFIQSLVEDASRYGSVQRKVRQPRKPRTVPNSKKIKNLKYQKEDKQYKVASINPEKIIGAQELWTFNTKYGYITVLRALDRGGLQVKGTTITGYDEKNSFTRRTGRKSQEHLSKVVEGGKLVLRKVLDDLKEAPLASRINENTILIRVFT